MTTVPYELKKQVLIEQLRATKGAVRLVKDTSNLFRHRKEVATRHLDVRQFNEVLHVDASGGYVKVEGMTPYVKLVDQCLLYGVMPTVVPQLKSITIGGATTGCGIESSSFRYGLVHETVQEMEILLSDGRIVLCTPTNDYQDLFFGFPNSYGTLGYALKLKIKTIPVSPYVRLTHLRFNEPEKFFEELERQCERKDVDFVDGVVFGRNDMVITLGQFADQAPYTNDYSYERIFYCSLRERTEDYLSVRDYIWRWDTDWFWCSKNVGAQNPLLRRLFGRKHLNSITYTKIMRWNNRWNLIGRLNRLRGIHTESVIQDVEIPIEHCLEFFQFYHNDIGILPMWICPTRAYDSEALFDLYRLAPNKLYVNFGFWGVIRSRSPITEGRYNRKVEEKVIALEGMKSLYSDSFFTPEQFWSIYNRPAYDALKLKYDSEGRFKNLFRKGVLRE